jgi:hypothetical protein
MTKPKPEKIDILEMELSQKLPHWLSPSQQIDPKKFEAERKRRRQAHAAKQNAKNKKGKAR